MNDIMRLSLMLKGSGLGGGFGGGADTPTSGSYGGLNSLQSLISQVWRTAHADDERLLHTMALCNVCG